VFRLECQSVYRSFVYPVHFGDFHFFMSQHARAEKPDVPAKCNTPFGEKKSGEKK